LPGNSPLKDWVQRRIQSFHGNNSLQFYFFDERRLRTRLCSLNLTASSGCHNFAKSTIN